MPPGYFVEFCGQFENQQRAAGRPLLVGPSQPLMFKVENNGNGPGIRTLAPSR